MNTRFSIEEIRRRAFRGYQGRLRFIQTPEEAGVFVVTSPMGCLSHLVRYVSHWTLTSGTVSVSYQCQCGTSVNSRKVIVVDPNDELFGCHRCIEVAFKHGEPTFNLVPETGCEATGGAHYRPKVRAR